MRIACLQFAPQVGDVNNNLNRADAVLSRANPDDLDLLVLPELAFSGYNFKSLSDISPFLEPTGAGITSLWARTTALKYNCVVAAGYPEKVDVSRQWPTSPEYYNSVIVVNQEGETTGNYRKSHLYYTDETWALEGSGFYKGYIPGVGRVAMGICMDLNPYRFEAPWSAFEFAFHALDVAANVVVLSMAWLTREDARHFSRTPKEPDMETMTYWIKRLEPLIRAETDEEIIVIFANRTGTEEEAVYAGTSAVIGIQHGEVSVYGLLGRGEKELLVVDTSLPPFAKLVYRPEGEFNPVEGSSEVVGIPPVVIEPSGEAESPAPSAVSVRSNNSGSNGSKPQTPSIAGSSQGAPIDAAQRIFGGHVFITQDALTPATGTFPTTPFEESPASPRYFWLPPDHPKTPDPLATRSSTSQSLIKNTDSMTLPVRSNSVRAAGDATEVDAPRNTDSSAELAELVETLRRANTNQTTGAACPARPSSPKSRNASRTGRGERSDSVLSKRPTSSFGHRARNSVSEQDAKIFRPESPKSRNASRNRSRARPTDTPIQALDQYRARSASRNQTRRPTPLNLDFPSTSRSHNDRATHDNSAADSDQQRQHSNSPDMEKIGADLLVFEEGERRPRRDSLECHADEDDFVVFHASMRRDRHGANKSHAEKEIELPDSQKSSTPKHAGSPGLSFAKSPKESWLEGKPQASPDRPDSRAISRGRQRTTKWAESQASPRPPSYKSSALASPPKTREKSQVSLPVSSFSRYKSPEGTHDNSRGSGAPSARLRRDSSSQLMKGTAGNLTTKISSKNSLREAAHRSSDHSPSISSIRTVETTSAPTTPESVPPTPKAMVLEPDWDQGPQIKTAIVEKVSLRAIESELDRRKSVIW
ncbi:putative CN hydrolase domain-containing protein [Seiridium cardinale]|uniref:CN hydrolase domain-containing protein n=1 Tax=Seiridium cardinale TaxID=138064 RepID=A0ABR2X9H3_9PEZI